MFRVLFIAFALFAVPSSATAQYQGDSEGIFRWCTSVGELTKGLDAVVNEMQIYNNSRDIWRRPIGCAERHTREIEFRMHAGWYLTQPRSARDPQFWIPIEYVRYRDTRGSAELLPGVRISQQNDGFRPAGAYRADRYLLPRGCEREWVEQPDRGRIVRLYGRDRRGRIPGCEGIDFVGTNYRESRPRR